VSADTEAERRGRLPDLTAVDLSESEWDERSRRAGLFTVFDVTGRPAGPSDDDVCDAVEATMRAEGRAEEAARFVAMRPPAVSGDPPRECFVDDPDSHRRGPCGADFELRVQSREGRLTGWSLRALIVPGRSATGPWASLTVVDGFMRAMGPWGAVPDDVFERLLAATSAVFGDLPRHVPPPLEEVVRARRGGECAACGALIVGRCISVGFGADAGALRYHLLCAEPEKVRFAIEFHRLGEADLSEARVLQRGGLARCQACRGIIRKGEWRLSACFFDGALHLECALTHEREGFRLAMTRVSGFAEAEKWRGRLASDT
jgi:hypothetical protein